MNIRCNIGVKDIIKHEFIPDESIVCRIYSKQRNWYTLLLIMTDIQEKGTRKEYHTAVSCMIEGWIWSNHSGVPWFCIRKKMRSALNDCYISFFFFFSPKILFIHLRARTRAWAEGGAEGDCPMESEPRHVSIYM